jgi:HAE1 family hydrophobic/amphiphilic exporter-1/multidrug efflux pump
MMFVTKYHKPSEAYRKIDAPPVVSKADANSDAIISMTVQSDTRSQELSDYAENVISQRLETIPGVSGVQIWGQNDTLCDCGLIL